MIEGKVNQILTWKGSQNTAGRKLYPASSPWVAGDRGVFSCWVGRWGPCRGWRRSAGAAGTRGRRLIFKGRFNLNCNYKKRRNFVNNLTKRMNEWMNGWKKSFIKFCTLGPNVFSYHKIKHAIRLFSRSFSSGDYLLFVRTAPCGKDKRRIRYSTCLARNSCTRIPSSR